MPAQFDTLAGQLGNLAAVVAGRAAPTAPTAASDPVVALHAKWVAIRQAAEEMDSARRLLLATLVERWGEPNRDRSAEISRRLDPDFGEVDRLGDESDRLHDMKFATEAQIIATEPMTLEGVRCKLKIAICLTELLQQRGEVLDYSQYAQLALLRGAERALAAGRHGQ